MNFNTVKATCTLPADKKNTSRIIIHDGKLRNCMMTALTLVTVEFSACL